MSPEEWSQAWGADRLFRRQNDRQLPPNARAFLKNFGFPKVVIFECDHDCEISFLPITKKLVPYRQKISWGDFYNEKQDKAWSQQLVIGEEEFCGGGASYCVGRKKETVTRIDIAQSNPELFVNSGVRQFGESLLAAVKWSQSNQTNWRKSFPKLERAIRGIDPGAFKSKSSFWPSLIEWVQVQESDHFEITSDPERSRPRC